MISTQKIVKTAYEQGEILREPSIVKLASLSTISLPDEGIYVIENKETKDLLVLKAEGEDDSQSSIITSFSEKILENYLKTVNPELLDANKFAIQEIDKAALKDTFLGYEPYQTKKLAIMFQIKGEDDGVTNFFPLITPIKTVKMISDVLSLSYELAGHDDLEVYSEKLTSLLK